MKRFLHYFIIITLVFIFPGCAADRISSSAKTIGNDVATYQASLSLFQDELKRIQDDENARIVGRNSRRDIVADVNGSMQVEWMISNAKNATDIFSPLQNQGQDEVSRLLAPVASVIPSTSITFPIDKLGSVAKTMDNLSKGQSNQANMEFLVNYGIIVNKQIKALEDQAKKNSP